jgi:hypothetical protein
VFLKVKAASRRLVGFDDNPSPLIVDQRVVVAYLELVLCPGFGEPPGKVTGKSQE